MWEETGKGQERGREGVEGSKAYSIFFSVQGEGVETFLLDVDS